MIDEELPASAARSPASFGGNVHQARAAIARRGRQMSDGGGVEIVSGLARTFRRIDRGIAGGVDDPLGRVRLNRALHLRGVRDIKFRMA
jgi:hypothetical protein